MLSLWQAGLFCFLPIAFIAFLLVYHYSRVLKTRYQHMNDLLYRKMQHERINMASRELELSNVANMAAAFVKQKQDAALLNDLSNVNKVEFDVFTLLSAIQNSNQSNSSVSNPRQGDLILLTKSFISLFSIVAENRKVNVSFDTDILNLYTDFELEIMERILLNVLFGVLHNTSPGDSMSILLNVSSEEGRSLFRLYVTAYTNHTTPPNWHNNTEHNVIESGETLLKIAQELVTAHNGTITIESVPDSTISQIITIPITLQQAPPLAGMAEIDTVDKIETLITNEYEKDKKALILLIEDDADFRAYLKDNLSILFNVVEAINGREGWQKTLSVHPDLVVSDITMPEMDGLQLCGKIKQDIRTAHIPVILLTALPDEEHQLQGLGTGANDYITKPCNTGILLSKIKNLLAVHAVIKNTQTKLCNLNPDDLHVPSADEAFIKNILDFIEKNIQNTNLTVEELSRHMCMSRVSLYKKVLVLTGKTPVDFIRSTRLKRAARLLEKSKLSIAEIAFEVGFNTPHYFAKSFKTEFKLLPSDFVQQFRREHTEDLS